MVHFSTAFIYLEATIAVYFWKHKAYVFHVNNVLIEELKNMKGSGMVSSSSLIKVGPEAGALWVSWFRPRSTLPCKLYNLKQDLWA